uniref:Ovule protein n=1 Tax=Heterorhabditis bacteriophora TaxID=37862 RepID=A0A1I7XD53_HETBA
MTSPFDADDLMKRSLLSSIMGFKRKVPKQNTEGAGKTSAIWCSIEKERKLPELQNTYEEMNDNLN